MRSTNKSKTTQHICSRHSQKDSRKNLLFSRIYKIGSQNNHDGKRKGDGTGQLDKMQRNKTGGSDEILIEMLISLTQFGDFE